MDSCPLPNDLQGQAPACRNDGGGVACRCAFVAGHRSFAGAQDDNGGRKIDPR